MQYILLQSLLYESVSGRACAKVSAEWQCDGGGGGAVCLPPTDCAETKKKKLEMERTK